VLAAGDGRWGLEAPWDVFLETAEQRCWWHKVGNLAALTKSAHPGAKRALAEIYNADNKTLAVKAAHSNSSGTSRSWRRPRSRSNGAPADPLRGRPYSPRTRAAKKCDRSR